MRYTITYRFPGEPEASVTAERTSVAVASGKELEADGARIVGIVGANGETYTLHELALAVDGVSFE